MKLILGLIFTLTVSSFSSEKKVGGEGPISELKFNILGSDSQTTLANYTGHVVMLDFWASWCLPCAKSMPKMQMLQNKYPKVKVLGINLDNKEKQALKFLKKYEISFDNLHDKKKKLAEHFDIKGMPTVIVLDKKGAILLRKDGYTYRDIHNLEEIIKTN